MTTGSGSGARIPTVHKLAQLLDVFTPSQPIWRLADLGRELGWDPATTHRFATALAEIGVLDVDDERGYRIGLLPQRLAAVAECASPDRHDLHRRIGDIAETTELTTQIGILDRGEAVIIASREGRGALNAAASLGARLPLHVTAVGKAMLRQKSDEEIRRLLPRRLQPLTERTICDRESLIEELRDGGQTTPCVADSELSRGVYALAVPLPSEWFGSTVAALACVGLSRDLVPEKWETAERVLVQELDRISQPEEEPA